MPICDAIILVLEQVNSKQQSVQQGSELQWWRLDWISSKDPRRSILLFDKDNTESPTFLCWPLHFVSVEKYHFQTLHLILGRFFWKEQIGHLSPSAQFRPNSFHSVTKGSDSRLMPIVVDLFSRDEEASGSFMGFDIRTDQRAKLDKLFA